MLVSLSGIHHTILLLAFFIVLLGWWLPYRSRQERSSIACRHKSAFTVSYHRFDLSLVFVDYRSVQDSLLGQDLISLLTDAILSCLDCLQNYWVLFCARVVFHSSIFLPRVIVERLSGIVVVVREGLIRVASLRRIAYLDVDFRNARLYKRFLIFLVFRFIDWDDTRCQVTLKGCENLLIRLLLLIEDELLIKLLALVGLIQARWGEIRVKLLLVVVIVVN